MITFFSSLKRHDTGLSTLLTICAISLILSIGYAINFKSIFELILNEKLHFQIWAITYALTSGWLFILCLFMIIITLFGVKITVLSNQTYRIIISIFFFIGICGFLVCFLSGLASENNNSFDEYMYWQYQFLLYILCPLYLTCLILFFNNPKFTQIIRLILFSLVLFITPFINLISITLKNKNNLPVYTLSAYASICIATSIFISFHIICIYKYYNSGLFIKSFIIILLTYGIIVLIVEQIDLDSGIYINNRIYYYYILLISLFIIYAFEIFVPGQKKLVHIDIHKIIQRPSYNHELEKQATISPSGNKGILQFVKKNKEDIMIEKSNPNENIESVIKIFPDFKPVKANKDKYFSELKIENDGNIDRTTDSITAIVPFYNEGMNEIHATLRTLYFNFEYIKKKNPIYKFTHFNVLLVSDGWFKADITAKRYLAKLYNIKSDAYDNNFNNFHNENHKYNTVILQTKHGQKLCINPFNNAEKKLYLKVTTIVKIDNRKKANSHEWFLGKYGFAEWCKCDYMFFTDAYSTTSEESLYRCMMHMKKPINKDVVCCTGRARVYTMEQELQFENLVKEKVLENDDEEEAAIFKWWQNDIFRSKDENKEVEIDIFETESNDVLYNIQDAKSAHCFNCLSISSHLRSCQMFEFEALYGTIGCYLLGSFLPVIPGPCGFYRSKYLLLDEVRGWYFEKINQESKNDLILSNMKLAEDRILTISSILNCNDSVRHSFIPECVFYFDPIISLTQLMKQRRRWLNGSIATLIFVLFKVSLSNWNVNIFRRFYVISNWYMQLCMYCVVALSPPIIFIVAFQYGLQSILAVSNMNETVINTIVTVFMVVSWCIYIVFIYFMQRGQDLKIKCINLIIKKKFIVQFTLFTSFLFGLFILIGTLMQIVEAMVKINGGHEMSILEEIVLILGVGFFIQSFVLAPLVSKDFKTLIMLLKTFFIYFMYSPFYVTYFFVNSIANMHDISWGTRPDDQVENHDNDNPKKTTIKLLIIIIFCDIILAVAFNPLSQNSYLYITFFLILAFPSLYQILFGIIWLIKTRFNDLWNACLPKRMKDDIKYDS